PSSGAAEARVHLVQNQEGSMIRASAAKRGQKPVGRQIDPPAHLDRLDQNGTYFLLAQEGPDSCFDEFLRPGRWSWTTRLGCLRELQELSKLAKLLEERAAKMRSISGIEGAIAQAVVRIFEGDHPGLARGQYRGFEGSLNSFESGVAENGFG